MEKNKDMRENNFDGYRDGKRLNKKGRKLVLQSRKQTFRCVHCKFDVPSLAAGTIHRNHCPLCLWSRHVDDSIGDRRSDCGGAMKPIGLTIKSDGVELMGIHQCLSCGKISKNRLAGDDNDIFVRNVFKKSHDLSEQTRQLLTEEGIVLCDNEAVVKRGLYGAT